MPHDQNGNLLAIGDRVLVPALVSAISPGEEYCNLSLETVLPMYPGEHKSGITLNAHQVYKDFSLATKVAPEGTGSEPVAGPASDAPDASAPADPAPSAPPLERCDCSALPVPHVHEQGGPVAIPEPTA